MDDDIGSMMRQHQFSLVLGTAVFKLWRSTCCSRKKKLSRTYGALLILSLVICSLCR